MKKLAFDMVCQVLGGFHQAKMEHSGQEGQHFKQRKGNERAQDV